ncbi:MAG: MerR family transcriptional regulator [Alphaproteobacteria bacterium]|nr:MerR family transcriptional regulator [Alphaproteobacteria bacterium]
MNTKKKSDTAFRTISEVSKEIDVPSHVLRFWETKFSQVSPIKRGGGRRYYRPEDVALLKSIRNLLYNDGYTIRGVNKLLQEEGVNGIISNNATSSASKASTQPPKNKQRESSGAIITNIPKAPQNVAQDHNPSLPPATAINKQDLSNIMIELEELKSMLDDIISTAA